MAKSSAPKPTAWFRRASFKAVLPNPAACTEKELGAQEKRRVAQEAARQSVRQGLGKGSARGFQWPKLTSNYPN